MRPAAGGVSHSCPCSCRQPTVQPRAESARRRTEAAAADGDPAAHPQAGHNMTIALPHGVLFPRGVSVQVDEAAEKPLAVQTSDQNGAYTGTPVDAAMLAAMRGGKTVKIGFTAGNGQRIVVPVTLRDFPAGLTALDKSPLPPAPAPAQPAAPAPR
ncbi:invasion associated locus B family protein [Sphingomonas sp. 7/4-4]|nr:invasion associated locus B family protein [Sphingomonas sp. 7/4-4]WBY09858.1 invasion associated locus B family protein [Sphingomonas sp. 7/4-4]